MGNTNPTPSQLLAALRDHGCDTKTYRNWDTIGRPWNYDGGGLYGVINHHTATASATGNSGCPTLEWAATAYDKPACNYIIGRGPGDSYLLSGGSCWHSGDGGPWPAIGINQAANVGHFRLFGIEIDDPGVRVGSMTDYQIEQTARVNAALMDLCGWDKSRIATHGAWTDGSYGVNPNGPSPYKGRKNDTIAGPWGDYPGATVAKDYNPIFWREQAAKYLTKVPVWNGVIPKRSRTVKAQTNNLATPATWGCAARLYDLGFKKSKPTASGKQKYPTAAMADFQKSQGLNTTDGTPTESTWKRLFGKDNA